jgi:DNA-binding Lrp family transcriptional regulator
MVSAIVLLTVERDKINSVADAIADIEGVSEVYSVAGRYDLAAIIRAKTNEDLAKVVTEAKAKIKDLDSLKANFPAIGKACGGCHETFRVKNG